MKGNSMIYLLFVVYVLCSSSGLILFKLGSTGAGFTIFRFNLTIKSVCGILCYGFSFLLWLYIVSRANLTIAMPLSVAFVNTLVVVESCIFLNEKITLVQGIGIFTVLLGVMIMTSGSK